MIDGNEKAAEVGEGLNCFVYGSRFQGRSTSGRIQSLLRASLGLAVYTRRGERRGGELGDRRLRRVPSLSSQATEGVSG